MKSKDLDDYLKSTDKRSEKYGIEPLELEDHGWFFENWNVEETPTTKVKFTCVFEAYDEAVALPAKPAEADERNFDKAMALAFDELLRNVSVICAGIPLKAQPNLDHLLKHEPKVDASLTSSNSDDIKIVSWTIRA